MVLDKIKLNSELYIRIDTKYGRYINDEKYKVNTEIIYTEEDINKLFANDEVVQFTIGSNSENSINNIESIIEENEKDIIKIENKNSNILNGHF